MQLTTYQQEIIEAVRVRIQTKGDKPGLLIEALAGAGKTTTLFLAAQEANNLGVHPGACRFVVFGKKNQIDLAAKIGKVGTGWSKSVQTLNSLGYSILRDCLGKNHRYFSLKNTKYLQLARDLGYLDKRDRDGNMNPGRLSYSENSPIRSERHFSELLEKLRLHCYRPAQVNAKATADMDSRYKWEFKERHYQEIALAARHCLKVGIKAVEVNGTIDFLDQIYYCWLYQNQYNSIFKRWSYSLKFIAIDEAQDTDELQIQFLKLLHRPANNFLVAVGDRHQAVYYFRGCLSNGLDTIAREFNCKSLPLPINYRCGKNHIELVRDIFPHIKIEAHNNAPAGEIRCIRSNKILDIVSDRSLTYFGVSRKNAPLLSTAIRFLKAGIPAKIKDRSLADKVLRTVEQVVGSKKKYNPDNFLELLGEWQTKQLGRYKSEDKHQEINDLVACLAALFEAFSLDTFTDWQNQIAEIFDESKTNEKPIDLYTIHSGKGGEGEISFLINPDDMPITYRSQTDEERAQEDNLIYVALTRCKTSSKKGSGIFYLILQTDDNHETKWPNWLPHKYRQIWGDKENIENEETLPDNTIDAAAEESPYFSGEVPFNGNDEIWLCPQCGTSNFETSICFDCGYQLDDEEDSNDGLQPDEIPANIEAIEVVAESSEPEQENSPASFDPTPVSFDAHKNKSERVRDVLLNGSDLSGEQIASQCGCSAMLVSKVRRKLEGEGLLEPVGTVKTANGRVMDVTDIGAISHSPRRSKFDKVRLLMEDLTGHELRLLFEEFMGPLPPNYHRPSLENEDSDDDIPF